MSDKRVKVKSGHSVLVTVISVISVVHNQPMPKRTDIGAILIIGAVPVVTGGAGQLAIN
ncbi:MAG: hypothetical protein IH926_07535 [Proteobacteria bacterium]|nr:hypothetical protein [Pseudomonadota bacterium]